MHAKTFQGPRYGNVPLLQEVEVDNQMYLIKTEIDEHAEGPDYETFCEPTNQEDCAEELFEVKEELDKGADGPEYKTFCDIPNQEFCPEELFEVKEELDKGAEGPEYETFCNPTNQEDCGDELLEVKDEPKDDYDSDEVWIVDIIKQDEG